ncbi:tRNA 2-thiouridine synthesizing protein C [Vibrio xiamenensis]|uniref:Protein TusC homolog n=1 Tax=Vibrio xiamenensis TaxID=861298 RepID=A0A1G8GP19_9VIBR|nr:sulfurtransferase complex subunit TusC [Vibrio xiamenensis]SDH96077.1 tRNA 2-thiouridine synthesizing protein C [Vibrio xiamenensis]
MSQLTFVFRSAPHGSASGREGVDALLAASAYCETIQVIFVADGVLQLLQGQQPNHIASKDYAPMFKLFELYDIEQVYVCQQSLDERGVAHADLVLNAERLNRDEIKQQLQQADKILSF